MGLSASPATLFWTLRLWEPLCPLRRHALQSVWCPVSIKSVQWGHEVMDVGWMITSAGVWVWEEGIGGGVQIALVYTCGRDGQG